MLSGWRLEQWQLHLERINLMDMKHMPLTERPLRCHPYCWRYYRCILSGYLYTIFPKQHPISPKIIHSSPESCPKRCQSLIASLSRSIPAKHSQLLKRNLAKNDSRSRRQRTSACPTSKIHPSAKGIQHAIKTCETRAKGKASTSAFAGDELGEDMAGWGACC